MVELFWRAVAKIVASPRVADYLIARAQRTPYTHLGNYMGRWWLFNPYPESGGVRRYPWLPLSIRVHHIKRADADRHLHDHPWDFRTIILRGYYNEERDGGHTHLRWRGDTCALKHGGFHRIAHVSEGGAWTMFVMGRYRRTWGFKIPHREYLGV